MFRRISHVLLIILICIAGGCGGGGGGDNGGTLGLSTSMVILGYNDLGMHCMNEDFSEFMILPPYNTLKAQIVDRSGEDPRIVTSGVTVSYSLLGNTHSTDKTNFWTYAQALLGVSVPPNTGLTGNGLSGSMAPISTNEWQVTGIPITPITDSGQEDPYQLATITVTSGGNTVASTQSVVPVSWEISCDLCHGKTAPGILAAHDSKHGTNLQNQKPVLCGKCHQQAPLGLVGSPGVPSLSAAMHGSHADRMTAVLSQVNGVPCYACHPGIRTKCQRDIHFSKGIDCLDCHGSMSTVASQGRRPWIDEPRCGNCHNRAGFSFEQSGVLYKDSKGHHGIHCAACHGSPHAITPTVVPADNVQAIAVQGSAGPISKCTVCHRDRPDEGFDHRL